MALDVSGWLPGLLPVLLKVAGVEQTARRYVNFVGVTAVDDSANDQCTITVATQSIISSETTTVTGTVNDHAMSTASTVPITFLRFTNALGATLTGLAGGAANRIVVLVNTGANAVALNHEDAASTEANRFVFPGATNQGFNTDAAAVLIYDATSSRWRMVGRTS